ncbi:hypothetical protein RFI_18024 [Reticulomyxa filosa]|uniref:Uncharacterized protein n=1 Tax=Reticulomyxa filosa TaxID=46433 RepID=X6MZX6_RETFI|nr:hypothetical protein RFI_18024 [Reticulomyxa filosa]|eukprot:ETO19203.1 hypothetical protein RFI_18024 [Reticulomyxa filosa]
MLLTHMENDAKVEADKTPEKEWHRNFLDFVLIQRYRTVMDYCQTKAKQLQDFSTLFFDFTVQMKSKYDDFIFDKFNYKNQIILSIVLFVFVIASTKCTPQTQK